MVQMSNADIEVSYFLSSTTRPHHGKASPIQKGLVPSRKNGNADLCEEGVGFGVPLLQYKRDFFFPGKASTSDEGLLIEKNAWKRFQIDLVERHHVDAQLVSSPERPHDPGIRVRGTGDWDRSRRRRPQRTPSASPSRLLRDHHGSAAPVSRLGRSARPPCSRQASGMSREGRSGPSGVGACVARQSSPLYPSRARTRLNWNRCNFL